MTDWQPIETAPKDGTRILLCHVEDGELCIGCWAKTYYGGTEPPEQSGEGWFTEDEGYGYGIVQPSHWMPLPDPPTVS